MVNLQGSPKMNLIAFAKSPFPTYIDSVAERSENMAYLKIAGTSPLRNKRLTHQVLRTSDH